MKRVKIFGAGSVGNHLGNACRSLGWDVLICDTDPAALDRTKNLIYPSRYGKWDDAIKLSTVDDAPKDGFDIIIVGTPPDSHIDIAISAIKESRPRLLLIEKPLATPDLRGCQELYELAKSKDTIVVVGYDHVLGKNTKEVEKMLTQRIIGNTLTMDVSFREYWGGILLAHPWLKGPEDSYLAFSHRGGGASGEHSHAANLWQHFAHVLDRGKVTEVTAKMDIVSNESVNYDRLCIMCLRTEEGFMGTVIQDVITIPTVKSCKIQGEDGYIKWEVGYKKDVNLVRCFKSDGEVSDVELPTSRPEDFILEMQHVDDILEGKIEPEKSPIYIERGLDTMMVVAAAHISHKENRTVYIDYSKGYSLDSLK